MPGQEYHPDRPGGSRSMFTVACLSVAVGLLMVFAPVLVASVASIPVHEIDALQSDLAGRTRATSAAEGRRICKRVIQQAEALLAASPDAPNRFAVWGVLLDARKQLLLLMHSEQNRSALFDTARELRKAPDAYAELRLGADLLLMENAMAEREAGTSERSQALQTLLLSYRGTAAEWRSLVIGSMIANKLLDFDLANDIGNRMHARFSGDHAAIQYLREKAAGRPLDVMFTGTYETVAGTALSLPFDRWGHQFIACFWSVSDPDPAATLETVAALQQRRPAGSPIDVLSFNLDGLPDAGAKQLRDLGLDWTVLHLPGGRTNTAYQAYARTSPRVMLVNAQGRALLPAKPGRDDLKQIEWTLDDERYLAQLRYLAVGDFLVDRADATGTAADLATDLAAIDACFIDVPRRYRLSREDELAHYRKANALCEAALARQAGARDGWMLRNRRIIALTGKWICTGDATHLETALQEAEAVLAMDLPPGADVVARACNVKVALRMGGDPERLIPGFLDSCGGAQAPPSAWAAAAMLAVWSGATSVFDDYRTRLLAMDADGNEALWPVQAFLRDRLHRHRLFHASPGGLAYARMPSLYAYRREVGGLADQRERNQRVQITLQTPAGGTLTLPDDRHGQTLAVIFVEPRDPGDPVAYSRRFNKARGQHGSAAAVFADTCRTYDVDVVVAMLGEGSDTGLATFGQDGHDVQVAMLPGGLDHPLVRRLGILRADRVPNVLLFRPDGTVAWMTSGLHYPYVQDQGPGWPILLAIANHIEKIRCDAGFEALERGEYQLALERFAAYQPLEQAHDGWAQDRAHGTALAYMGLQDWPAALEAIRSAIAERRRAHAGGRPCKCHGVVEMYLTQAMILDGLARHDEADIIRTKAQQETGPHAEWLAGKLSQGLGIPIGIYYDWLKRIRWAMEKSGNPEKNKNR